MTFRNNFFNKIDFKQNIHNFISYYVVYIFVKNLKFNFLEKKFLHIIHYVLTINYEHRSLYPTLNPN